MPRTPADVWNIRGRTTPAGRSRSSSGAPCVSHRLHLSRRRRAVVGHAVLAHRYRGQRRHGGAGEGVGAPRPPPHRRPVPRRRVALRRRRRERGRRRERVDDVPVVPRRDAPPLELTHAAVEVTRTIRRGPRGTRRSRRRLRPPSARYHGAHGNTPHLAESRA